MCVSKGRVVVIVVYVSWSVDVLMFVWRSLGVGMAVLGWKWGGVVVCVFVCVGGRHVSDIWTNGLDYMLIFIMNMRTVSLFLNTYHEYENSEFIC